MSTSKDLSSLVDSLQAKAAAKPSKAAIYQAKLDAKIASIIAKGKTVVIDGVTVTSYDLDSGSSGGGSSGGGSSTAGSTFVLSTNADVLSPTSSTAANQTTAGDDLIYARTANALQGGDVVNGGGGNDTLYADLLSTDGLTIAPTLTAVETVQIESATAATNDEDVTLSLANSTGVTSVIFSGIVGTGTNTYSATNLTAGTTVSVVDNDTADHDYIFSFASSALAGTADSVTVNLRSNGNTSDVRVTDATTTATAATGAETLIVSNSGAASTIGTLTVDDSGAASSLNTLVINASAALTITNSVDFEGTAGGVINAAGSTANVTVTATTGDEPMSITGGSGNDSITSAAGNDTISGGDGNDTMTIGTGTDVVTGGAGNDRVVATVAAITSADSINLGDGTLDAIIYSDATTLDANSHSSTARSAFAGATGVEAIGTSANVTAIDGDYFSVQNIIIAAGTQTSNLAVTDVDGDTIYIQRDMPGVAAGGDAIDISAALAAQTVSLVIGGSAGLTLSGRNGATGDSAIRFSSNVTTVNLTSTTSSSTAVTNTISSGAATTGDYTIENVSASTFTLSGATDFTIGAGETGDGFLNAINFNASAFTGILTLNASSSADVITGGSGNDVITGRAGNDRLTGGSGADDFVFSATNGSDTITDFVAGTDDLDILGTVVGAGTAASITRSASATTVVDNNVYIFSTDGTAASVFNGGTATITASDLTSPGAALAAFIDEFITGTANNTDDVVFVLNWTASGSTTTYIYEFVEANASATIQAAELTLLATVTRDAVLTTADII